MNNNLCSVIYFEFIFRYIVNMNCQESVEDIQDKIDKLQEENEEDD